MFVPVTNKTTGTMVIFFLMMLLGMAGILYLVYKDVPSAPWNKGKEKA